MRHGYSGNRVAARYIYGPHLGIHIVNLPKSSRSSLMTPIVPPTYIQSLVWDWALPHIRWQQMHILHQV